MPDEKPSNPTFTSPAGITLFALAGMVDAAGAALLISTLSVGVPLDDFGILDIIGLVLVGGMMYFHSRVISETMKSQAKKVGKVVSKKSGAGAAAGVAKGAQAVKEAKDEGFSKEAMKKLGKRLLLTLCLELIPYFGALWPSWIIAVYRHLKETGGLSKK